MAKLRKEERWSAQKFDADHWNGGVNKPADEVTWRAAYDKHLKSAKWRNMKADLIKLRGDKCERCGFRHKLSLHHKTYERLGHELAGDLELLCAGCHEKADLDRAAAGKVRSANARYEAAFHTYATKKYGEEYEETQEMVDEFDQWLESRP